jgi:hypothetical protein
LSTPIGADEIEAGCAPGEIGDGHLVVGLGGVAAVDAGPADLGDLGLEREQSGGAGVGIGFAGERQHIDDVRAVGVARLDQFRVRAEVIIAVGEAEAGLAE